MLIIEERLDELEIDLGFELGKKRDRHERLPIRLITNHLDPSTHSQIQSRLDQLNNAICYNANKLNQLQISFGDLAVKTLSIERNQRRSPGG